MQVKGDAEDCQKRADELAAKEADLFKESARQDACKKELDAGEIERWVSQRFCKLEVTTLRAGDLDALQTIAHDLHDATLVKMQSTELSQQPSRLCSCNHTEGVADQGAGRDDQHS